MPRLLAIGFIWLCCAGAWAILGSTLLYRSGTSSGELRAEVQALWGPPLGQLPPTAIGSETHTHKKQEQYFDEKRQKLVTYERDEEVTTEAALSLERSDLSAALTLEHRRKGLLWFPTYDVAFQGAYAFRNDTAETRHVALEFPLTQGVVYDAFAVKGADGAPVDVRFEPQAARFVRTLAPGEVLPFTVSYRTRGIERWDYGAAGAGLGPEKGRAKQFTLRLTANVSEVDFPAGALSPTRHGPTKDGGWEGTWTFDQIVGTAPIALVLPSRLAPGPAAARITFFAPVSLLFFFFVTGVLLAARRRAIHPMNYVLLGCAFFAFHLLFAYLIDHVEVGPAFAAASVVSVGLVVSYARLFVGWRLALLQLGLSQLVYLVLFSLSFFWQGFTGLAITVGAIATLFVVMQITGRVDWSDAFGAGPRGPAGPPAPAAGR